MTNFEGYTRLLIERDDTVLTVTINRPERLNAVDNETHLELERVMHEADHDTESRCIVLTGAGRAFCAGGDVQGMKSDSGSPLEYSKVTVHSPGWHLINAMLAVEKPMIAQVNGAAVGLGATMALMCDSVIIADEAKIGDTHVNVGLVAGDGGTVIWPLLIGPMRAKEMLMTGKLITGVEAAAMGLVNRSVPLDGLREETMALARKMASMAPYAVRATKQSVNRYVRWMADHQMDTALAWEHLSMTMEDHHEAVAAWSEKRAPVFKGR